MKDVYMGTMPTKWMSSKNIKTITFNVTDDCNLACTYCYFIHKSSCSKMDFSTAKKAVDYILHEESFQTYDGVVWDFIGGEPTLEAPLISKICDYILESMYHLNHKWLYCYRFMIGTNGLLYSNEEVQKLIKRYKRNLQIAITIDGSKEKHDLSRIRKDGSGSYDDVVSQIPLWKTQQGAFSTKSTFAHADLPYLKDSIINLWNLGITNVLANVVFEECWHENDPVIFESQLKELADYVIENNLWNKVSVRFFDPNIGHPLSKQQEKQNFCGAGNMLAISVSGDFYPCVRFMETALDGKPGLKIGNIDKGIDSDRLRAFYSIDTISQSTDKCLKCEIASGCAWCSGNNYCYAETETIFDRKTFICDMHHANVRAAEYFWKKYEQKTGIVSPMRKLRIQNTSNHQKYLNILLENDAVSFCQYKNHNSIKHQVMPDDMVDWAVQYCFDNHIVPIFVGTDSWKYSDFGLAITTSEYLSKNKARILLRSDIKKTSIIKEDSVVLVLNKTDIGHLYDILRAFFARLHDNANISVFFDDLYDFTQEDLVVYKKQLVLISDILFDLWTHDRCINLNLLTHLFYEYAPCECNAGIQNFTLAPDGYFYLCPAFYYDEEMRLKYRIGDTNGGISNLYQSLCDQNKNTGCRQCASHNCLKCLYLNKKWTGEFCVPPEISCIKSNIERIQSSKLYNQLKQHINFDNRFRRKIDDSAYFDLITANDSLYMRKYNVGDLNE